MNIWDAIYGKFELPRFLSGLLTSPEFRRLTEVRLININSPSLASLADVRRYSHTLGALRLALENKLPNLGNDEHKAFLASIIIHDAGTPAFAHLFEYFLIERFSWDHESVLPLLLKGEHHTDANSHQIFVSQIPKFKKLCSSARIDYDIIISILEGRHPSSKLIFGTLDFDNIDNVARMNWMLGYRFNVEDILSLARNIGISSDGDLLLPVGSREQLELWQNLRRQAYKILVFDGPTVAGQAVLSRAIRDALDDGTLSEVDWHYTDSDLVRIIRENSPKAKERLDRDFFGMQPKLSLLAHVHNLEHPLKAKSRDVVAQHVEAFLRERYKETRPYGYMLRDRGTFEKTIKATDPNSGEVWRVGERSDSVVLYGFGIKDLREDPYIVGKEFVKWFEAKT